MTKPNRPTATSSPPQLVGPLSILNQAIRAVPALKYALGLAGIAAAIAIIKTLITDLRIAVFGIIVMLVLMTVLFVFAKLTLIGAKEIRAPAIALMWFSLLITITTGSLLFTSVFFNWPLNLKDGTDGALASPQQNTTPSPSATPVPTPSPLPSIRPVLPMKAKVSSSRQASPESLCSPRDRALGKC